MHPEPQQDNDRRRWQGRPWPGQPQRGEEQTCHVKNEELWSGRKSCPPAAVSRCARGWKGSLGNSRSALATELRVGRPFPRAASAVLRAFSSLTRQTGGDKALVQKVRVGYTVAREATLKHVPLAKQNHTGTHSRMQARRVSPHRSEPQSWAPNRKGQWLCWQVLCLSCDPP